MDLGYSKIKRPSFPTRRSYSRHSCCYRPYESQRTAFSPQIGVIKQRRG